jgi:sigma-B regulation protein RsbU (phosphoserine phosphatase)
LNEFIRRLNVLVLESTARYDYVTYFIAEIDSEKRTITYINAGHPPPYTHLSNSMQSLSARTLALGLRDELPQLAEHCISFPQGSVFVAYTDGILERTSPDGVQYGEGKLVNFICRDSAREVKMLADNILAEVRRYGGEQPFDDDATVVVVRSV